MKKKILTALLGSAILSTPVVAMEKEDKVSSSLGKRNVKSKASLWEEKAQKSHFDGRFDNFNHLAVYDIPLLHAAGLTGKGYDVSILEANADINHPTLAGKIEVSYPLGNRSPSTQHGNHVSALIVGNKTDQFDGGIAPDAKGYVIGREMSAHQKQDVEKEMLSVFEEAAKLAPVINLSGTILTKGHLDTKLSQDFIKKLHKILETKNAVLVITASNDPAVIGKSEGLQYLDDLVQNKELVKHLLIVGNLGYESQISLEQKEQMLKMGAPLFLEALKNYAAQEEVIPLKSIRIWREDFIKFVSSQDKDLAKVIDIPEVQELFRFDSPGKLQQFLQGNMGKGLDTYLASLELKSENLETFLKTFTLENLARDIRGLHHLSKTMPGRENYLGEEGQRERLFNYIKNLNDFENTDFFKAYEMWKEYFQIGWWHSEDLNAKIEAINKRVTEELQKLPEEKRETGHVVSTQAGSAKDHFIMTYGENIRSAWNADKRYPWVSGYENHTGSSQAAPITTGILVLLHQYYKEHLHQEKSWPELIQIVKESARPLGNPEAFGLGMLDTTRLFPEIIAAP